jgi:sec-independent protein translocase protein TatB
MFDISAGELIIIGVVALVVIGPKELPGVLRTVGQAVAKIRRMAGEFQSQFSDAMREAELDQAKKSVEDIGGTVSKALDPTAVIDPGPPASSTAASMPMPDIVLPEIAPVPEATSDSIRAEIAASKNEESVSPERSGASAATPDPAEPSAVPSDTAVAADEGSLRR